MGTAIKHHVPDQPWASECPNVKNYKWWLNRIWSGTGCFI